MTYDFFTAQLRFVAKKTARESNEIALMMDSLEKIAKQIEKNGNFFKISKKNSAPTARALAGVAGFLQQHILPEAIAAGHGQSESQIRWSIDTCMELMGQLMTYAEQPEDNEELVLHLSEISI